MLYVGATTGCFIAEQLSDALLFEQMQDVLLLEEGLQDALLLEQKQNIYR